MGDLRSETPVVLVLGRDGELPDVFEDWVGEDAGTTVAMVDSLDGMVRAIDGEETVGCVVVTEFVADPEPIVERCHDADPDLPVVVATGSLDLAPALTVHGNVVFLGDRWDDAEFRSRIEEALDSAERRRRLREDATIMRSYLRGLRNSLFVKDEDRNHVRVSHFPGGIGPEDVMGETATVVSNQSEFDVTEKQEREVIEEGEHVHSHEQRVETRTSTHWFRTSKAPWYDEDGEIRGLVGLSWDATDEMRIAQQLETLEDSFETFARSLSHDVRTPLQVARGNLELARDVDDEAPLDDADRALDRIAEMIEDLETVTGEWEVSLISGEDTVDAEAAIDRTNVHAVANSVWSVLGTGNATLSIDFDSTATIFVDESTVRPLLENLFRNAITHGGEGVDVRLGPLETGGFFVEDDGPGIPAERRPEVLEEGYTTSPDGSGTGLSIVQEIANKHSWGLELTESGAGGARIEIHNCMLVDGEIAQRATDETVTLDASEDVGPVEVAGESDYDGQRNRWKVRGAGTNIWRRVNEFHFAHTIVDGPVRIQGKIVDVEEWSQYTKAGFMVRDSLEQSATYGYVGVTPNHGTEVLWRTNPDSLGVSQHLGDTPLSLPWYRLEFDGETATASVSATGEEWHAIDRRTVHTDGEVHVGLAVCSHMPQRLCEATFESVSIQPLERPE